MITINSSEVQLLFQHPNNSSGINVRMLPNGNMRIHVWPLSKDKKVKRTKVKYIKDFATFDIVVKHR